jgi:hypothetical protein
VAVRPKYESKNTQSLDLRFRARLAEETGVESAFASPGCI